MQIPPRPSATPGQPADVESVAPGQRAEADPTAPAPRSLWRRALLLLAVCGLALLVFSLDEVHAALIRALTAAEPVIAAHPRIGAVAFVLLSAGSAMLAFFSSAVLVPVAVVTWGRWLTIALLWLGWLIGGLTTYAIGRQLGRPLINTIGSRRLVAFYQGKVGSDVGFPLVLLLQLALPSELPGYLFGMLRVRLRTYLAALAVAELPYAIGTVLLGESIVQRQGGWLLVLAGVGAAIAVLAALLLRRRLDRGPRPPR